MVELCVRVRVHVQTGPSSEVEQTFLSFVTYIGPVIS